MRLCLVLLFRDGHPGHPILADGQCCHDKIELPLGQVLRIDVVSESVGIASVRQASSPGRTRCW